MVHPWEGCKRYGSVIVRKHLETIVMRPGVPSRTAAVTRAFPWQVAV